MENKLYEMTYFEALQLPVSFNWEIFLIFALLRNKWNVHIKMYHIYVRKDFNCTFLPFPVELVERTLQ